MGAALILKPLKSGYFNYPMVCLFGLWLKDVGFLRGQPYEGEVSRGTLILRAL